MQLCAPSHAHIVALGRAELDIADEAAVQRVMAAHRPDAVMNAAAYTAVDRAESDSARAYAVNADGPGYLARACAAQGARLIHVSTDFVFSGEACHPYRPGDATAPVSVYGASKRAGEQRVREVLGDAAVIVRTAWVYSRLGNNFVKTMLRLMAEREQLSVVADQVGTPTWAHGLAAALWRVVERPHIAGTLHWTDAGIASWYDFAVAIEEEARHQGLLARRVAVKPIAAIDYPTPAKRPAWSVLDKSAAWQQLDCVGLHWREALRQMLADLKTHGDTL
jgi:dTDP-4-dehydrorhamnose reductase